MRKIKRAGGGRSDHHKIFESSERLFICPGKICCIPFKGERNYLEAQDIIYLNSLLILRMTGVKFSRTILIFLFTILFIGESEKGFSASKSQVDDLETYKHKNTITFRNASIIRVSLNINDCMAIADDGDKKIIKQLSVPASMIGLLLHNNSPDENEIFGQYLRSPDIALLLFRKWSLKPDQYHSYHSMYFADKKNQMP